MRLIDADALIRKFKTSSPMAIDGRARQMVEEMPTIEPERKTGRWIPTGKDTIFGVDVRCSVCGESFATTELAEELYCRHCGVYMGGEEDEAD